MSATMMILFMLMAVFVNVLTYAGISWIYFADKHRVDPPKTNVHHLAERVEKRRSTEPEKLAS